MVLLQHLRRGQWIAYKLDEIRDHGLYVRSGYGFGPILAGPGDTVCFTETAMEVNGVPQARLPHMPSGGTMVVEQKCWFVWPELARQNYVHATEGLLTDALMRLCTIRQEQVIGTPFKRWFWRRQM